MTAPADLHRLLELAAKVAGHLTRTDRTGVWLVEDDGSPIRRWAPHRDDGDALRLAVKLQIKVGYDENLPPELGMPRKAGYALFGGRWFAEVNEQDPCAAVRMAVLRAAAAIGEAMP